MKRCIPVIGITLAILPALVIGACMPTMAEVVSLPSPTSRAVAKPPATLPATALAPNDETSSGTCRFKSNGDLISGWYWLRDADYAAYGEWDC